MKAWNSCCKPQNSTENHWANEETPSKGIVPTLSRAPEKLVALACPAERQAVWTGRLTRAWPGLLLAAHSWEEHPLWREGPNIPSTFSQGLRGDSLITPLLPHPSELGFQAPYLWRESGTPTRDRARSILYDFEISASSLCLVTVFSHPLLLYL